MKIKKENEQILLLDDEDRQIEEYSLDKTINFEKLIKHMLSKNLSEEIHKINTDDNIYIGLNEIEKYLVLFINTIIEKYNSKVREFNHQFPDDNK